MNTIDVNSIVRLAKGTADETQLVVSIEEEFGPNFAALIHTQSDQDPNQHVEFAAMIQRPTNAIAITQTIKPAIARGGEVVTSIEPPVLMADSVAAATNGFSEQVTEIAKAQLSKPRKEVSFEKDVDEPQLIMDAREQSPENPMPTDLEIGIVPTIELLVNSSRKSDGSDNPTLTIPKSENSNIAQFDPRESKILAPSFAHSNQERPPKNHENISPKGEFVAPASELDVSAPRQMMAGSQFEFVNLESTNPISSGDGKNEPARNLQTTFSQIFPSENFSEPGEVQSQPKPVGALPPVDVHVASPNNAGTRSGFESIKSKQMESPRVELPQEVQGDQQDNAVEIFVSPKSNIVGAGNAIFENTEISSNAVISEKVHHTVPNEFLAVTEEPFFSDSVVRSQVPSIESNATNLFRSEPAIRAINVIADAAKTLPTQPVEIALSPEELGSVKLTLQTTESGINLSLFAERPETLDLLRRNIELLAAELRTLGYEKLNINFFGGNENFGNNSDRNSDVDDGPTQNVEHSESLETESRKNIVITDVSSGLDLRF